MKICTKCNTEKPEDDFGWRNKAEGRRNTMCFECVRQYNLDHYYANHAHRKSLKRKNSDASRTRARDFIAQYLLGHPCAECGDADIRFLEFDHIADKNCHVTDLVRKGCSLERIQQEIALCQVLCIRCHRLKSLTDMESWRLEAYEKYQSPGSGGVRPSSLVSDTRDFAGSNPASPTNHPDVDPTTGRVYSGSAVIISVEQAKKNARESRNENQSGSWSGLPLNAPFKD